MIVFVTLSLVKYKIGFTQTFAPGVIVQRLLQLSFFCFFILSWYRVYSFDLDVVYGNDDRLDIVNSHDAKIKKMSKSVMAQIYETKYEELDSGGIKVYAQTLAERNVCSREKFSNDPMLASCTGFLIGPKKLLTAGHCLTSENACDYQRWVLDFVRDDNGNLPDTFEKDKVFKCTRVLKKVKDPAQNIDYAVVELDRAVTDREPLSLRNKGKVAQDDVFTVIGFPNGTPMKISVGAEVLDNSNKPFFTINSDTFSGNSGSPVINNRTYQVEGILVRGEDDFAFNPDLGCNEYHRLPQKPSAKYLGEYVTRSTSMQFYFGSSFGKKILNPESQDF